MINGRPLKDCSDALLFAVWDGLCGDDDPCVAKGSLRYAIEMEIVIRRCARAVSRYPELQPVDRFPRCAIDQSYQAGLDLLRKRG